MVRRGLNAIAVCQNASGRFIEAIAAATDAYSQSIAARDARRSHQRTRHADRHDRFSHPLPDGGLPSSTSAWTMRSGSATNPSKRA